MVKIKHQVQDENSVKRYGVMPAIVDDCTATVAKTSTGKEYTQLTVDLIVNNETENAMKKKMFFRIPYDSWVQKPGEPESLFNQFRRVTKMSSEELNDTKNYKGKGFYVVIGPERTYSTKEWKTFEGREGGTLLSFNVIKILEEGFDEEKEEEKNALLIKKATEEINGEQAPIDQPGFESPQTF